MPSLSPSRPKEAKLFRNNRSQAVRIPDADMVGHDAAVAAARAVDQVPPQVAPRRVAVAA